MANSAVSIPKEPSRLTTALGAFEIAGVTTNLAFLKALLEDKGLKAAILSIDDLYLTLPERERLAVASLLIN